MDSSLISPIVHLAIFAAAFWLPALALLALYFFRRLQSQERLRAIERGVDLTVDREATAARTRRSGIVCIAGGLGLSVANVIIVIAARDPVAFVGERYGQALRDLIRLGLMTGARLNELCELQQSDLLTTEQALRIREGKTENATRVIPVHPSVWPLLEQRSRSCGGDALFAELAQGGPDGKRSWYASKR